ncbi:MAG: hypothetical protein BMS9Abin29_0373 [Gemmatimonadota bacterium]|nr:MAG: hypothetical protein BMS9Abin29_0373 [Gemmatimonadota bacterium]
MIPEPSLAVRRRASVGRAFVLSVAALASGIPAGELVGQTGLIALRTARVAEGGASRTLPILHIGGRRSGEILNLPFRMTASAWLNLDDPGASLVNVEQLTLTKSLDAAEFRIGVGNVPWGLSEMRSPMDVLAPRALLWSAWDGPRLGGPLVGLTLFRGGSLLEAVALPFSRPMHLGGYSWRTWSGLSVRSDPTWDDRVAVGLRFTRTAGPVDLAISYINGWDRSSGTRQISGDSAKVDHPRAHQLGFEFEWAQGPSLSLRSEGALPVGTDGGGSRLLVGIEWYPAPYLSLLLEHSMSGRRAEFRTPLEDDLLVAVQLLGEQLRFKGRFFFDPRSSNTHYSIAARRMLGELMSVEMELLGAGGDPLREPPLAFRQPNALLISIARYF